ncbi:hypothetical protein BHM03_00011212 [Ensete ventricosum]|nr:hypothetical protein BHM03_00011212 [Ensete ventricosum]
MDGDGLVVLSAVPPKEAGKTKGPPGDVIVCGREWVVWRRIGAVAVAPLVVEPETRVGDRNNEGVSNPRRWIVGLRSDCVCRGSGSHWPGWIAQLQRRMREATTISFRIVFYLGRSFWDVLCDSGCTVRYFCPACLRGAPWSFCLKYLRTASLASPIDHRTVVPVHKDMSSGCGDEKVVLVINNIQHCEMKHQTFGLSSNLRLAFVPGPGFI